MDDYERYEVDCKKIRKENKEILKNFRVWLKSTKLKEKTIKTHVQNVDLYINEFLLYEDALQAKDGSSMIDMFLGYWFIKKVSWGSPAQIKSNATSLKKFYTFLFQNGEIEKEDLNDLKSIIKEEMSEWIATMDRYNDDSITDMGEVWGL